MEVRDNRICQKRVIERGSAGCPVMPVSLFPSASLKRNAVISKQEKTMLEITIKLNSGELAFFPNSRSTGKTGSTGEPILKILGAWSLFQEV